MTGTLTPKLSEAALKEAAARVGTHKAVNPTSQKYQARAANEPGN